MIEILDKQLCCGCEACACACPTHCIYMIEDEEGFLYPEVDMAQCIQCAKCETVCPVINVESDNPTIQHGYIVQSSDPEVLLSSTSGGVFTELSKRVLHRGGVVFGVAFNEMCMPYHNYAESERELACMRGSKYVQSRVQNSYQRVEELLDTGREVLFSGTPCQIEGLVSFLKGTPEELLLVDIVCHAVPSPLVWRRYLEMQYERQGIEIGGAHFRDKVPYGYQYSQMTLFDKAGKRLYSEGVETDPFLRAFFSEISNRPICYACPFKKRYRLSDLTIWDCWNASEVDPRFNSNSGATKVLSHSDKGVEAVEELLDHAFVLEIDADILCKNEKEMLYSVEANPARTAFLSDCLNMKSSKSLFNKWFPVTVKTRTERCIRKLLAKTGVLTQVKPLLKKLKNRGGNE